ncbi:MAG TPA: PP2C family protein-serine/threonine phosphatase [Solirubrobacteraceae bacterium]|jgi:serine phosphatase RsbU (regulator of sigma subunit)|nr:PP2C family protein-serine/threonine phosphatase [Solirubrobacteraceae bacterium]
MSVRPASSRIKAAAGGGLLAAILALGAAPAGAATEPKPLLSLSVGNTPLLSIESSLPIVGKLPVKVEVLSKTPEGSTDLAGVSVGETSVTVPAPTLNPPTVTTPTVKLPETPATPKVEVPGKTISVPSTPGGTVTNPGSSGDSTANAANTAGSTGTTAAGSPSSTPEAASVAAASAKRSPSRGGRARSGGRSSGLGRAGAGAAVSAGGGSPSAARPSQAADTHRARSGIDPLSSLGSKLPLPLPVPDWSKPIILLLLLLVIAFGVRSRLATRRARRLERRQSGLLKDLETMQAALAPEVPAELDGLGLSVAYRPADGPAAGGDFYDVFALETGLVAVILGDVAGHGHEALKHATLARYTLRAFMKETREPRAALRLAGHALSEPDSGQLVTVAIALFDARRGTLTYALAGHPPPILLGVARPDAPSSCSSPPLGLDMPTGRRQRTISLTAGERACFFSDGLIEARRSAPGNGHPDLLGRDCVAELFAALPAEAGAEELLQAIREEAAATPDDMAACILTPGPPTGQTPIDREELEVDRPAIEGGHVREYLLGSGLAGTEATRLLAAAASRLEHADTVMLEIDRSTAATKARIASGVPEPERPLGVAGAPTLQRA